MFYTLLFAIARVAGAVVSTLASILSPNFHLRSLKMRFLGCYAKNKSLGCGPLVNYVREHLASSTAVAALAIRAAATVSSAARHFFLG